jgi:hypothetical protein
MTDYQADAIREAADAMAYALADEGHDEKEPSAGSCLGCAALAQYAKALEVMP